MKDFSSPDYLLEGQPNRTQSRRFLGYTDDNCLTQVIKEPMGGDILLVLIFTNKEALVRDEKVGSNIGCSYYDRVFIILKEGARQAAGSESSM